MLPISVITIVHQRQAALHNLIEGFERSIIKPAELVVICMNDVLNTLNPTSFPLAVYNIDEPNYLPLAKARNLGAIKSRYNNLVFLDVDCIPGADSLGAYNRAFEQENTLWTGPVRYLAKNATLNEDVFDYLEERSKPDQVRDMTVPISYELFWSLNFGCTKNVFKRIGGFDDQFRGYGAEDTDFSFSARKNGVDISWVDAPAYHQYHPSYNPPLNHLKDIVANAQTFKQKWGIWPMKGWLRKFQESGYIDWNNDLLTIKANPTPEDISATLKL